MQNPLSELATRPWHYAKDGAGLVLGDIDALKNLSANWKKEDTAKEKAEQKRAEREQRATEYVAQLKNERNTFMRNGIRLAKLGQKDEINQFLVDIQKELRLLEPHDHFDQLFGHNLELLRSSLNERLQALEVRAEDQNALSISKTGEALKKYTREYRMVTTINSEGKKERKLQPAVKTEISETDTQEEWQVDAEFESHFNRIALTQALENEVKRQELLQFTIREAVENALARGLISEEVAQTLSEDAWKPDAEFEAWFEGKTIDGSEKLAIQENLALQSLEEIVKLLLKRVKNEKAFHGIISPEVIKELEQSERNIVQLRHLKNSAEVVARVLFSTQEFSAFIWNFLTRPDIKKSLLITFDENSLEYWKSVPPATRAKYNNNPVEYVAKKHEELEVTLSAKNNQEYASFLLTFLGVDVDLLVQAVDARFKNNSQPFMNNEQASRALLGEKGHQWWQDVQRIEDEEPFLTPLTKRKTLLDDDITLTLQTPLTEQEERMNFIHALHLKIGLDTPSKFIDYDKAHEIVENKALNGCLEVLNQLFLLRTQLPQEGSQQQLDHLRNEQRFIKWNMAKFAQAYARLNQELGEMNARNTSQDAPARERLMEVFVSGGEPKEQTRRLSALVSLIETELPAWLETHTLPQENVFTSEQNEEERMS